MGAPPEEDAAAAVRPREAAEDGGAEGGGRGGDPGAWPEHWFSKWERQCLAEAEPDEQLSPELQEEAAAAAQPEHKQQKLWHLFQNSATTVAQLYKDRVCQQPGLSLWVPFQNAATAVTNLYKVAITAKYPAMDNDGVQLEIKQDKPPTPTNRLRSNGNSSPAPPHV